MFFDADPIDCSVHLKFAVAPDKTNPLHSAFLTMIKEEVDAEWKSKQTKWSLNKDKLLECLENSPNFRRRLKLTANGISFYAPNGDSVDMVEWMSLLRNFNPDELDDDLSTLPKAIKRDKDDQSSPESHYSSSGSSSGTPKKQKI